MRLVHVEWIDSNGGGGWQSMKEALRDADENTLRCESVGWLLEDNERYLLLVPTLTTSTDRQVCDPMQIPQCAVLGVRPLTPGRKRR